MLYNTLAAYFTVAGQKFPVSHFSLLEASSYPSELSVSLIPEQECPIHAWVGQTVLFEIEPAQGEARSWQLRCEEAHYENKEQGLVLNLVCRSAWAVCFKVYHTQRVFCHAYLPDLVDFILSEQGLTQAYTTWLSSHEAWSRPHIVQGPESDGAFLSRICARENLHWFARQDQNGEILHFIEHPRFLPVRSQAVIYRPPQSFEEELRLGIFDLEYHHRGPLQADEWLNDEPLRQYSGIPCFQAGITTTGMPLRSYKPLCYEPQVLTQRLKEHKLGEAEIMKEGYRAVRFESNYPDLTAGLVIDLASEAGLSYAQGAYRINYIRHQGVSIQGGEGARLRYSNTVIAQAQESPWRGILNPRPLMPLVFQAKIESAHELTYLDETGRETVRSVLDSHHSEKTQGSIPIPRATPYAHASGGMNLPLYPGAEVLMTCLHGDLDCPVILGTVYNEEMTNPVNASNPWLNLIRTEQNQTLLFDDTPAAPIIEWSTHSGHMWVMRHLDRPGFFVTSVGGLIMQSRGSYFWKTGENYQTQTQGGYTQRAGEKVQIESQTGSIVFKAAQDYSLHALNDFNAQAVQDFSCSCDNYQHELESDQTIVVTQGEHSVWVQGATRVEAQEEILFSSLAGDISLTNEAGSGRIVLTQAGVITVSGETLAATTELDKQAGIINYL